jgi:hypothetical protein
MISGCRPLRGLFPLSSNDPGVPLRSTPGSLLSPRFAGSTPLLQQLVGLPKGSLGQSASPEDNIQHERGPENDSAEDRRPLIPNQPVLFWPLCQRVNQPGKFAFGPCFSH